ncbi:MAG: nucleotidyltransferase domain-containing protein [Clostridiales bacterium]|nr:nucleotidyltransferase domain-containing protein [Clostridiales bacterium]
MLSLFSKGAKKIFGADLRKIILYGSYARGDYNEDSDVDIMILTSLKDEDIEKVEPNVFDLSYELLMDYGVDIRVIVKNEEHFNYWLGALPFYNNVQREGIILNG